MVTLMDVQVTAEEHLLLDKRLTAEVVHMVAEGVSNVRRHTSSPWARVEIRSHQNHLLLRIENAVEDRAPAPFTPRSLTERATRLGGDLHVVHTDPGKTQVCIDIPL